MLKADNDILASDFIITLVAGEALSARDAVYILTSDGKAYKCDADDSTKIGFIGFTEEACSSGANINIRTAGIMPGFSGLTINAPYYVSATNGAITATKPTNYKLVGIALSATVIKIAEYSTIQIVIFDPSADLGSDTTRFDITNPAGSTFRYTYDGTGTDPGISAGTFPVGTIVQIFSPNMTAANCGSFVVTGSGANYFEVTNASGVAENDKTIAGDGYFVKSQTWTKLPGLRYMIAEGVGAGASGAGGASDNDGYAGGGAGAYSIRAIMASQLAATEVVSPGVAGPGISNANGFKGGPSIFGSFFTAGGGNAATSGSQIGGDGGTASGGDQNVDGGDGMSYERSYSGSESSNSGGDGGASFYGGGGRGARTGGGESGQALGSGGGGGKAPNGGGAVSGGHGKNGSIKLTLFF